MLSYDVIGDIHGQAELLERLLGALGYRRVAGVYQPDPAEALPGVRRAVFVGDLIDRGCANRRVIEIVRAMVEAGHALAVMGNHELNAVAYHTRHSLTGRPLRQHTDKNRVQHQAFLDELPLDEPATRDVVGWLRALPLFLELPGDDRRHAGKLSGGVGGAGIRVVHACWNQDKIDFLRSRLGDSAQLDDDLLIESTMTGTPVFNAVETLLKGPEIPLPEGSRFVDKDGHERRRVRDRWWATARTYRDAAMVSTDQRSQIPDSPLPRDYRRRAYAAEARPVFFGHYWLEGDAVLQRDNVACLDYSVGKGGPIVAYRWRADDYRPGAHRLRSDRFVTVGLGRGHQA